MLLLLWILPYFYSRRASGPKKVLWAINGINTKVALWPFQAEEEAAGWDGRNFHACPPSSAPSLFLPLLHKPFLAVIICQAHTQKNHPSSHESCKGDPQLCFWVANKPFPFCSASPQPQHAREQFRSRAFSRLALRSQGESDRAASPHWPEDESSLDCFQLALLALLNE